MKMTEFLNLATKASRCNKVAESDVPEALMEDLPQYEKELVRAAIRRIMAERRDNLIERAGVHIEVEV